MFESILGIKKPIFGLDIGHVTIKLVQIKGTGTSARLWGAIEVPIPEDSLNKEGIREKQQLASIITQAMKNAKPHPITAKIAASALPEYLVYTKLLDVPKMSQKEISKNIPYQIKEVFPISPKDVYADWQIVGQKKDQLEVFVVAAPIVLVNSVAEVVSLANMELMGLETKPIAITRALVDPNDMGSYLILDIGAKTSGLTCYSAQAIRLTSTLSIGCDNLKSNTKASIETLSAETLNLYKYYQNRIDRAGVFTKIILAGGGANITDIAVSIEKSTNIKTEIGQPRFPIDNFDPRFATALGLAMKEILIT